MKDKDLARLQHMLDSTRAILGFLQGKSRTDLDVDRLLLSGVIRELEILGEAAGKVSQKTQDQFSSPSMETVNRHAQSPNPCVF